MGIENLTKLEMNDDGTYTATCNNRCGTEVVSGKEIILGRVCEKLYPDNEGSFLGINEEFEFTCYAEKSKTNEDIDTDILDAELTLRNFTLKRHDRFHHTLSEDDGPEKDCLRNKNSRSYDYYSRFPGYFALRVYMANDKIEVVELLIGRDWHHCIEGSYNDECTLKQELKKRLLRKKAGEAC